MRKLLALLFLILFAAGAVALWQKDRVIQYFHPTKLLVPFYHEPNVYDLLSELEKNGIGVSSPPVINGGTIQATISGVTVYFTQDKDFFTQVRSLQLVLPKVKMEESASKIIDLRFSKVVIR